MTAQEDKQKISLIEAMFARLVGQGFAISDQEKTFHYLRKIGPNRIIDYAESIRTSPSRDSNVSIGFDSVLHLYKFDRHLRLLSLDALERIEIAVKSDIERYLNDEIGERAITSDRLNLAEESICRLARNLKRHGHPSRSRDQSSSTETKGEAIALLNEFNNHQIIKSLSFGSLSRFFGEMPDDARTSIPKNYDLDSKRLMSCLRTLTTIRNKSAHHDRLWNIKLRTKPDMPRILEQKTGKLNTTTFYAQAVITYHLLQKIARNTSWHQRLKDLIAKNHSELKMLDVQKEMGFPDGWHEIAYWNPK